MCQLQSLNGTTKSKRKHPFITASGKLGNIFTASFFNEAIRDETTITWKAFKEDVFYSYLQNMSMNINKIKSEILTVQQIDLAFKELTSEKTNKCPINFQGFALASQGV